jgi:hypothetical protein
MNYEVEVWVKAFLNVEAETSEEAKNIALETWDQYPDDADILGIDVYDESGELIDSLD